MSPLADAIAGLAERHGLESLVAVIVFVALRPLGLVYGFVAFAWGLSRMRAARMAVAIALGLPMVVVNAPEIDALIAEGGLRVLPIGVKEVAIGYALGFFASLPIYALQFAGGITDAFRGEADSGLADPTGGTLQTFSLLYLVVGLSAFFALGGLWTLTETLYRTYAVWPLGRLAPPLAADAPARVSEMMAAMLALTVRLAVPLLALLVALEFAVAVAARMAQRYGLQGLAFPVKNLAAMATLPLVAWFAWGVAWSEGDGGGREALAMLALLLGPEAPRP